MAFPGRFLMKCPDGTPAEDYKGYSMFRNTYGYVFLLEAATKGRGWAIYFARDSKGHDFRTTFPVGRLSISTDAVEIKTRYNTFSWDNTLLTQDDGLESLLQWIRQYGDNYIPGFRRHPGVNDFLK